MQCKRNAITLALIISVVFVPHAAYAQKFKHMYTYADTGVYGRVTDSWYSPGLMWGMVLNTQVNSSTYPNTPMFPVTTTMMVPDGWGGTNPVVCYVDHEATFVPTADPTKVESAQSALWYYVSSWDPATITP